MRTLEEVARGINKELESKSSMKIGKVLKHPDGRTVKVTSGCYLDPTYGRVSNFWYWRGVKANGKLGKEECGYGW